MKRKLLQLRPWLPTVIVLLALLYLTLQSPQQTTDASGFVQRCLISLFGFFGEVPSWVHDMHTVRSLAHIPEYFLLGIALWIGFKSVSAHPAGWSFLAGGIIGLLDEVLKELLPTREFDLGDWRLDLIGVGIALGFCWAISTIVKAKRKPVS